MVHIYLFLYIKILIFYLLKKIFKWKFNLINGEQHLIKKDLKYGYVMSMKHLRSIWKDIQNNKIMDNENNMKFNRYSK